jgi:CDP-diacylglycerol---glycerol-3-phosphate 3-phosphatidyltransferase
VAEQPVAEHPAADSDAVRVRPAARIGSPPNLLGIARILATPVVAGLILVGSPGTGIAAFVVFALASFTDYLDGWLARRRDEVSALGIFMDLTADKVLVVGVLVAMVEAGLLPTWMVGTIVIRELVVSGIRQVAASADLVIGARLLGKAKTATTMVGMGALLLAFDARTGGPLAAVGDLASLQVVGYWMMVVATVLTVASGWDYVRGALPLLRGQTE